MTAPGSETTADDWIFQPDSGLGARSRSAAGAACAMLPGDVATAMIATAMRAIPRSTRLFMRQPPPMRSYAAQFVNLPNELANSTAVALIVTRPAQHGGAPRAGSLLDRRRA